MCDDHDADVVIHRLVRWANRREEIRAMFLARRLQTQGQVHDNDVSQPRSGSAGRLKRITTQDPRWMTGMPLSGRSASGSTSQAIQGAPGLPQGLPPERAVHTE